MKNYWTQAYSNIQQRCTNPKATRYESYGGKGIKCLTNSKELKELFKRDNAHLLSRPSIDRINPDGNYEKSNMRWIEFTENSKNRRHPKREKTLKSKGTMMAFIIPDGLLAKLRVRAKAEDRNVSEMARHIIKAALDKRKD